MWCAQKSSVLKHLKVERPRSIRKGTSSRLSLKSIYPLYNDSFLRERDLVSIISSLMYRESHKSSTLDGTQGTYGPHLHPQYGRKGRYLSNRWGFFQFHSIHIRINHGDLFNHDERLLIDHRRTHADSLLLFVCPIPSSSTIKYQKGILPCGLRAGTDRSKTGEWRK